MNGFVTDISATGVLSENGNEGIAHQGHQSILHITIFRVILFLLPMSWFLLPARSATLYSSLSVISLSIQKSVPYCLVSIAWAVSRPIKLRAELNYSFRLRNGICLCRFVNCVAVMVFISELRDLLHIDIRLATKVLFSRIYFCTIFMPEYSRYWKMNWTWIVFVPGCKYHYLSLHRYQKIIGLYMREKDDNVIVDREISIRIDRHTKSCSHW